MIEGDSILVKVPTTGLRMEVYEAGSGPLMVMLHGFPEHAGSWRFQMEHFSGKYRCVAPNMRGYGGSDRPRSGYDMNTLAYDVAGLFDHYNAERAVLVGHDWGGVVAWHFAYLFPQRLDALVIMDAPHPVRFESQLRGNPRQLIKSWYVFAFQLPFLPELYMGMNGAKPVGKIIRDTARRKDVFTPEVLGSYSKNMSTPGALAAGIKYYRRAMRDVLRLRKFYDGKKIVAPTQVIWAQQDAFLEPALAEGLDVYIDAPLDVVPIHDCGHWVNQEAAEEVNEAMERFLKSHTPT